MKLRFVATLLLIAFSHFVLAQDTSRVQNKSQNPDTTRIQDSLPERLTFSKVEVEAQYPGGNNAWLHFLVKHLRYPEAAINKNIQGKVWIQFIVDQQSNVSDVQAFDGPDQGGLREEAIRLITTSGKWTPGLQNGRQVRSYKKMPITFNLSRG